MRHSLKNRIISGFAVLSLIVSTFGSVTMSFAEGEPEASLYAVMSEKSEEAEVSVFSSSDDSEIEVVCATETDAEIASEEGLEVVENYLISEREEESDETPADEPSEPGWMKKRIGKAVEKAVCCCYFDSLFIILLFVCLLCRERF